MKKNEKDKNLKKKNQNFQKFENFKYFKNIQSFQNLGKNFFLFSKFWIFGKFGKLKFLIFSNFLENFKILDIYFLNL